MTNSPAESMTKQCTNPLLLLSNATILFLWISSQFILIPYVVHLLLLVISILYTACHSSLILRQEQALCRGEIDPNDETPEGENPPLPFSETLRTEDAMQFPIVGIIALFSLYYALKFFDKETVNFILSAYSGLMGCVAVAGVLSPLITSTLGGPFKKDVCQGDYYVEAIAKEGEDNFGSIVGSWD